MATGNSGVTSVFLSNGFIRALAFFALAVAPGFARSGAQTAGPVTALPPTAPVIPTTIKNAPFSAQVATEYDHVLANGNHIHRETHGRIFRDSQGRVRTETQVASLNGVDSLEHIAIQDPILREVIHLDPRNRTASVYHLGEPSTAVAEPPRSNGIPSKGGKALLSTPETSTGSTSFASPHQGAAIPAVTETLGTRMIEGLPAIGTRTTRTIANGEGDPIVAVREVWYSRDLQMIILSISDDGQSGHSVMRVTNIMRGAPNEKLFQVPPDYTVKDGNPIAAVMKH